MTGQPRSTAPLRIFVGTHEVGRQVYELTEAFRELGHTVTSVVYLPSQFYPDAEYDVVLQRDATRYSERRRTLQRRRAQLRGAATMPRWILEHDVFAFVYGQSLLPLSKDLRLLRLARKSVASIFVGSDVRHWSAAEQFRQQFGLRTYSGYRQGKSLDQALWTLRTAELYSNAMFLQPSYAELALAPYQHLFLAVDPSLYEERIPGREVPVLVHAPSRRVIKGTAEILFTLEELRAEGLEFELRLLEGVPNVEVRRALTDADIVIDELNECHYGMLGLEGLASGCVVLCGNRPDIVPIPAERPLIHIQPDNLKATLRHAILERDQRVDLARRGRPFVERHHDRLRVAAGILDGLARASVGDFDYVPKYFAEEYRPPEGVHLGRRGRRLNRLVAERHSLLSGVVDDLRERGLVDSSVT